MITLLCPSKPGRDRWGSTGRGTPPMSAPHGCGQVAPSCTRKHAVALSRRRRSRSNGRRPHTRARCRRSRGDHFQWPCTGRQSAACGGWKRARHDGARRAPIYPRWCPPGQRVHFFVERPERSSRMEIFHHRPARHCPTRVPVTLTKEGHRQLDFGVIVYVIVSQVWDHAQARRPPAADVDGGLFELTLGQHGRQRKLPGELTVEHHPSSNAGNHSRRTTRDGTSG